MTCVGPKYSEELEMSGSGTLLLRETEWLRVTTHRQETYVGKVSTLLTRMIK